MTSVFERLEGIPIVERKMDSLEIWRSKNRDIRHLKIQSISQWYQPRAALGPRPPLALAPGPRSRRPGATATKPPRATAPRVRPAPKAAGAVRRATWKTGLVYIRQFSVSSSFLNFRMSNSWSNHNKLLKNQIEVSKIPRIPFFSPQVMYCLYTKA